jgi:uncharacterized protein
VPLSDRDYMRRAPPGRGSRQSGAYEWFTQNPVLVLIAVNIVFFLATSIKGSLIETLGLSPEFFLHQPWTIITSMFVHENIWHILFNMIALFFFGRVLLQIIGQNKFLLVYFIGGILGNVAFIIANTSSGTLVVGASGAIYAIAGALVVMMPNMRVALWGIIPMPLWVFVVIFLGLLSLPPFTGSNIAWQAHMGGLATGLVTGYIFRRSRRYIYNR